MTTFCSKFWKFCLNLNRTRLHKIRRPRARNNYIQFYNKNLLFISSRRTRNSQFIEKHDTLSHFCFSIAIHAKKPTESWHKAVKNMSKSSKNFTLHWNCCEELTKMSASFQAICRAILIADLLNSLKQGTTGNWILRTQMLAPANLAWVFWLCCLCWCSGNYTVKHKRVFILSGWTAR